jgi:hypothetical protein
MEAKNFRIGNYYEPTDGTNIPEKVKWEDLAAWESGAVYGKEISITTEWLIDLGFKKKGSYWFPNKSWHRYLFHGYVLNLEPDGCDMVHAQVRNVHELQNLFFALTGKELELKKESSTGG